MSPPVDAGSNGPAEHGGGVNSGTVSAESLSDLGAPSTHDPIPSSNTSLPSPRQLQLSMLSALQLLLRCPVCSHPFAAPTTLHCGHSVCAHHLHTPAYACPVPTCAPSDAAPPNIPSTSTVTYFPAPPDAPAPPAPEVPSRVDVTISKVIDLVACADAAHSARDQQPIRPPDDNSDVSDDDDDDDEDEGEDVPDDHPSPRPSASSSALLPRSRPRSDSASPERPRKRPRRHPPPETDDDDHDLLSHLRRQSVRQRSTHHDQPLIPSHPPLTEEAIHARFEKDLLSELTCEICFTLFYQPVTTPCQHTFCAKCLHRSLDHSPSCPLCRQDLPRFSYFQEHPENKVVLSLLLETFPTIYQERGDAIEAEERDARLDTPIFICQLSFPGVPTLLHFFEPRYRLMLRRCLESPNPRFGMVMPARPGGTSPQMEYGTMLEIRSVQMLPDGRSMVETWGTHRFRLLESGTLDGYMVGRIERIDDYPVDPTEDEDEDTTPEADADTTSTASTTTTIPEPATPDSTTPSPPTPTPTPEPSSTAPPRHASQPRHPTNAELMDRCRTFLAHLQRGTAPWVVQRLSSTYGAMPTDASSFSFWVALVLPIDEHEKAKLLPIRSARLRLLLVVHWIEQLNNNWWFSSGCQIL